MVELLIMNRTAITKRLTPANSMVSFTVSYFKILDRTILHLNWIYTALIF